MNLILIFKISILGFISQMFHVEGTIVWLKRKISEPFRVIIQRFYVLAHFSIVLSG